MTDSSLESESSMLRLAESSLKDWFFDLNIGCGLNKRSVFWKCFGDMHGQVHRRC